MQQRLRQLLTSVRNGVTDREGQHGRMVRFSRLLLETDERFARDWITLLPQRYGKGCLRDRDRLGSVRQRMG
jgi:hypothetical protein